MSTGGILGSIVGGVIGFFIGGPLGALYGATMGFSLGMMIDPITPDMPQLGVPDPQTAVMSSTIGSPVPDLLGTGKITGHLLCYGKERVIELTETTETGGKGGGETQTHISGYEYYMTWALGICAGPVNTLYAVYKGEDLVWEGELELPESGGQETITLDGMGSCTFYFGTEDQVINPILNDLIPDSTLNSPMRNFCWALMDDCKIGNVNRTPTITFMVTKQPICSFSERNIIQEYDYNPAHAMWYILHNLAGLPTSWLNESAFETLALSLLHEYRGISILFVTQQSTLSYLQNINMHTDCILNYDSSGKFTPKLIRDDYDVGAAPLIDENVMTDYPSFTRKSWIDTVSEIKVQYTELIEVERDKELAGKLYGVGYSVNGEAGVGQIGSVITPFTESPNTSLWQDIAFGGTHVLGLKTDGTLWLWGKSPINGSNYSLPVQIGTDKWKAIGCGYSTIMAVNIDGTLWGASQGGADIGFTSDFAQLDGSLNWEKVTGGQNWIICCKSDGTLWGMGSGTHGQFGEGDQEHLLSLTMLSVSGVTDVKGGQYFSIIVCGSSAWVAGNNTTGQLGLGDYVRRTVFVNLGSFDQIVASGSATMAVINGGVLSITGQNSNGQLGLGDTINRNILTPVPGEWEKVGEGAGHHTMGIRTDGTIWGSGFNYYAQLGAGQIGNPQTTFVQEITHSTNWVFVGTTYGGSIALA